MVLETKRSSTLVLRLIAGLALLGCARVGAAQGTWSVIPTWDWGLGPVWSPTVLAADAAGNLYVADKFAGYSRIQKRDARGNWSVITTDDTVLGPVRYGNGVAVDRAGNLYVFSTVIVGSEGERDAELSNRDAQGNWSRIATYGVGFGRVGGLAVDLTGDLYLAYTFRSYFGDRNWSGIRKWVPQGNWSVIADFSGALATDSAGNLYAVNGDSIHVRDAEGNWSLMDYMDYAPASALATDAAGNLYTAGWFGIQKRDVQGHWSVIATEGSELGQVSNPSGLTVDGAGNLYVADSGNNRVLKYTPDR